MTLSVKARFKEIITPILLVVTNIFVFTPFYIYKGNISEFRISFTEVLEILMVPFSIAAVILVLAGLLFKEKAYSRYLTLLFLIGLMLWLEANILVWDYGLLNGQGIDWSIQPWRGWVDGLIWLMVLSLGFLFTEKVKRIAVITSAVLISLQFALMGWYSYKNSDIWTRHTQEIVPPQGVFEFSSSQNVIHIILDAFQASAFDQILQADNKKYSDALDGFVYFKDTVGSFPTTYMSVPAILTGENYQNKLPMQQHINSAFAGKNIVNTLHENGFKVDFIPLGPYLPRLYDNYYTIPGLYGDGFSEMYYKTYLAAGTFDVGLFRCMPHWIKKYIYNDQKWCFKQLVTKKISPTFQSIADKNFFKDFINKSCVTKSKPNYKFVHLAITHQPIVMNEKGVYAGGVLPATPENFVKQDQFGLDQFIIFINKLKTMGIYDNSLIILQADHGSGIPVNQSKQTTVSDESISNIIGSATPLVVIKPPHSKGPLRVSSNAVSLVDIPKTITDMLHINDTFPGKSMFAKENLSQNRKYYHYKWVNDNWQSTYFKILKEYTVSGEVTDEQSWQLTGLHTANPENFRAAELKFGTKAIEPFLGNGWSENESLSNGQEPFNWAIGNKASLIVSLPKNKPTILTAKLKTPTYKSPQIVNVKVDGKPVGQWKITDNGQWQEFDTFIMPSPGRPDVSIIQLEFSQWCSPTQSEKRSLAVMFGSIMLHEFDSSELKFGTNEVLPFLRKGWSQNESARDEGISFNWAMGKSASIGLPLPTNKPVELVARVKFMQELKPQLVSIRVNGKTVGSWTVSNSGQWEDHRITVPPDAGRPAISTIEFLFERTINAKNDKRPLALLFNTINIKQQQ